MIDIAGFLSGRVLSLLTDHCWFSVLTHLDNQPSLYISFVVVGSFLQSGCGSFYSFHFVSALLESLILKIWGLILIFFVKN